MTERWCLQGRCKSKIHEAELKVKTKKFQRTKVGLIHGEIVVISKGTG